MIVDALEREVRPLLVDQAVSDIRKLRIVVSEKPRIAARGLRPSQHIRTDVMDHPERLVHILRPLLVPAPATVRSSVRGCSRPPALLPDGNDVVQVVIHCEAQMGQTNSAAL